MPALEQISDAIAKSATCVKYTTKASRAKEACKKPRELGEAQKAIFKAQKGMERQEARRT